jgi:SAM-dependent methyltransferase
MTPSGIGFIQFMIGDNTSETKRILERYSRRQLADTTIRYHPLKPDIWQACHERRRVLIQTLVRGCRSRPLEESRILEIGCGYGGNLLELLSLGCSPSNLHGFDLLKDRVAIAQQRLPPGMVRYADALVAKIPAASFDIVYQSTVFSSILSLPCREDLSKRMWKWLRPGGAILWYDFIYDNPRNQDVRGVPLREVRALFPEGRLSFQRVTLAPPIARAVCRLHPRLYEAANLLPFLRSHVMCWIEKP